MNQLSALFHLLLSFSLHAQTAPAKVNDACTPLIGSCDYYTCVENSRISCGSTGYPLGYGENYCQKLSALTFYPSNTSLGASTFPADGNEWRDEVRTCLQVEMEDHFARTRNISCEELNKFAFDSHPKCYTQSTSFCDLNVQSVVKVGLTISPADLLTKQSLTQVAVTAGICANQLNDRIKSERNLLVRMNLIKYRTIWNSIAVDPSKVSEALGGLGDAAEALDD